MGQIFCIFCALAALFWCAPLRAETITGRVVGPDGAPVAAQVFLATRFLSKDKTPVQSEADGRFQIEIARPEPKPDVPKRARDQLEDNSLVAYAPGFALGFAPIAATGETVIALPPDRVLSDVIRDDKGAPVVGAKVSVIRLFQALKYAVPRQSFRLEMPKSLAAQFSAQTDDKGQWQIKGLPAEADVYVQLDDENYVIADAQYGQQSGITASWQDKIVAQRAGAISGRVVDANGAPVAKMNVIAVLQPETSSDDAVAARPAGSESSDEAGIFRFKRLPPGTYALLLNKPEIGFLYSDQPPPAPPQFVAPALEDVQVAAGATAANFKLQLGAPARVSGRVLDREGKPMVKVAVGAFGQGAPRELGALPATYTDAEGKFELAVVPGDNALYAYEVARFGNQKLTKIETIPLRLQAGQSATREVKIERRFVTLRGQVVDDSNQPIPNAEVTLWNPGGTGQTLNSDEKGNFVVENLPKGSLRLDPRNQWSVVSPKKIVVPLPAGENLTIVLKANTLAKTTGRVVDSAGAPIEGVVVRFTMPLLNSEYDNARSILTGISDENGVYKLGDLKMPEALQLANENVSKDGYKLREGGGKLPATAKAESRALQLGDFVMERLNRTIAGKVTDGAGQPISGALVRASGDDYRSSATTDVQGQWTLGQQASGALEILAAHERAFGRAQIAGDATNATIVLEASAPLPPQDVKSAEILFGEMAPAVDQYTLSKVTTLLAPLDPASALQMLLNAPKAQPDKSRLKVFTLLDKNSSADALQWARDELANFDKDAEFIEATCRLGLLWEPRAQQIANDFFQEAQARRARLTGEGQGEATAWLTALATRLELPIAEQLTTQIFGGEGQAPLILQPPLEPLSWGSAALAERVLRALAPEKTGTINQYKTAIEIVAPYDAPGALRLLNQMRDLVDAVPDLPDENGQFRGRNSWEFEWAFAAKDVLRNLDRSDAASASDIARRVKLWHRASAFALAAEFGSKEQRLALVQETLRAETRGDWMKNITAPRLGALAVELDPTLAASLFNDTAKALEEQRVKHNSASYSDWSFYAAWWNPAQARLALEAEWQRSAQAKADEKPWNQASLAMAMSAVDIDRAIAMARQISHEAKPGSESSRTRALSFIGRFLLTPPAERRLLVVGFQSGYDS